MESELLFSQPAYIEIQGPHVLDYLEQTDLYVTYQVVGLQSPRIFIKDYRYFIKEALEQAINSGDLSNFAQKFSQPVYATLARIPSGDLLLEISDTATRFPGYMIWIVSGMEEPMPYYLYEFCQIEMIDEQLVAGVTIYSLTSEESTSFGSGLSLVSATT